MQALHFMQIPFNRLTSSKEMDPMGHTLAQRPHCVQFFDTFGVTFLISIGFPYLSFGL